MADFMEGLARGMDRKRYKVKDAVKSVAKEMDDGFTTQIGGTQSSGINVNLNNAVTVQVGNQQFDAYIVKTAEKGISNNRMITKRFRGRR